MAATIHDFEEAHLDRAVRGTRPSITAATARDFDEDIERFGRI